MNVLLVPMAGKGQRFVDKGFKMPKALIMVDNRHIIDYSFESILHSTFDKIIFVVRQDHINDFAIDEILKQKFGEKVSVVSSDGITKGSVCSCLLAKDLISPDDTLTIYTLDVYFSPVFNIHAINKEADGIILTFKANNPAYSYVRENERGIVIKTEEKKVISNNAAVGVYYFKNAKQFFHYAQQMIDEGLTTNGEYYICPLYNLMIRDGSTVLTAPVNKMYLMGTPEEMEFFVKNVCPLQPEPDKPIALCADHSGFKLKRIVMKILQERNIKFIDFGTYTDKDCDYNDYVSSAISHMHHGICNFGMGFCRSGQGVNICANKFDGVRSALVFDEYTAEYAIRHNCANFFSMPEKYVDQELAQKIIKTWLKHTFDGGRHISRVQKTEKPCLL